MSRKRYTLKKIREWSHSGLISLTQAAELSKDYKDPTVSILARTPGAIFAIVGLILMCLGTGFLVYEMWGELPLWFKVSLSIGPMMLFHLIAIAVRAWNGAEWVADFEHVLGHVAFGGGLVLLSTLFLGDSNLPFALLASAISAFILYALLQSKTQAMSCITFLAGYVCFADLSSVWQLLPVYLLSIFFAVWAFKKRSETVLVGALVLWVMQYVGYYYARENVSPSIFDAVASLTIPLVFYGTWYFASRSAGRSKTATTFAYFGHITFYAALLFLAHGIYTDQYVLRELPMFNAEWKNSAFLLLIIPPVMLGCVLPLVHLGLHFRYIASNLKIGYAVNFWFPMLIAGLNFVLVTFISNTFFAGTLSLSLEEYFLYGTRGLGYLLATITLFLIVVQIYYSAVIRKRMMIVLFSLILMLWIGYPLLNHYQNQTQIAILLLGVGSVLWMASRIFRKITSREKGES